MEQMLYPLRFTPILKDKIWGGSKIKNFLKRDTGSMPNVGESWELSGVEGEESVVCNGFLAGNNLTELIEIYMGDLIGDKVFSRYGTVFPLLIKLIDANDALSIQVHPNDELAEKRHQSFGKTEMWYLVQADVDAELIAGFNEKMDKEAYLQSVENNTLEKHLRRYSVKKGDLFFMPAGRVHAICKGCFIAEIQETSDITYRIYDYNRVDSNGNQRELHTDLAVDAINFDDKGNASVSYNLVANKPCNVVDCSHFTTNILEIDGQMEREYVTIDSFVIYLCTEGEVQIKYDGGIEKLKKGETLLIPAVINEVQLTSTNKGKLLEIYIK